MELLLRGRCFQVDKSDDISSWRVQKNGLPQSSLFHIYVMCHISRFVCTNQKGTHTWPHPLKPSTAETVSSVFHLHNDMARQESKIIMDSNALKHEHLPAYLRVTLDQSLTFNMHIAKLKSQVETPSCLNWLELSGGGGCKVPTLCTTALALCYSVTKYRYCSQVW